MLRCLRDLIIWDTQKKKRRFFHNFFLHCQYLWKLLSSFQISPLDFQSASVSASSRAVMIYLHSHGNIMLEGNLISAGRAIWRGWVYSNVYMSLLLIEELGFAVGEDGFLSLIDSGANDFSV